MRKIKILFADDHGIVRNGLRALFRSTTDFSIVGEASDGETAIQIAEQRRPDVVILDISMPRVNGIEATRILKQSLPEIKILILTIHDDTGYVQELIRAGANGYILKNAGKREIIAAVRAVADGEQFFSPSISKLMIEKFIQKAKDNNADEKKVKQPAAAQLTRREQEVLACIAKGMTSKEIAEKLFLSQNTVNTHRANLMQKLDIHETAGLVRYAIQRGLINVMED